MVHEADAREGPERLRAGVSRPAAEGGRRQGPGIHPTDPPTETSGDAAGGFVVDWELAPMATDAQEVGQ